MHATVRWLRRTFLAGLALVVPLVVTGYIFWFAFTSLDALLAGLVRVLTGRSLPGVGLAASLVLTLLAGSLATNLLGRRLIQGAERILDRIPGIRSLYHAIKQIVTSVVLPEQRHFRRAVLVEYPRKGVLSLGFVTHEQLPPSLGAAGDRVAVYVPTTPNPTSGFLILVPPSECIDLDLPVAGAFQVIISAGLVMPGERGSQERAGFAQASETG